MRTLAFVAHVALLTLADASFVCAADFGPAASVRRLDRDQDGYIEPEELNDRQRRFLDPIVEERGMDLSRRNSVAKLDRAVERYYEYQEARRSRNIDVEDGASVKGFEPSEDQPLVSGFGLPDDHFDYTEDDLDRAERILRRYDRNDDRLLSRDEARRASWRYTDPFINDFNNDGRLSRLELAQRYARRRSRENQPDFDRLLSSRMQDRDEDAKEASSSRDRSSRRRSSRSSRYLAYNVIERYDRNQDGSLGETELLLAGIERAQVDSDDDGIVDRNELDQWLLEQMEGEANDLSDVLPEWFYERDSDRDGQISMDEFADQWTDGVVDEFLALDSDEDGILTSKELLASRAVVGGSYANDQAKILMPRSVIISEIDVEEDIEIGDLDVQLSITHTYAEYLDGFLIGPDGEQIELFTGVGRNDDHFEETTFDDEAAKNITKARPPFTGNFQPEAVAKRERSLSHYEGTSVKGLWQLMIRSTRSDRAGILHGWSLIVTPAGDGEDAINTEALTSTSREG